jgi:L-lactate dehydrogenase complex protein LldG
MSAREEILGRIRSANSAAAPPPVSIPRDYRRTGSPADLLGLFTSRLLDYKATVRQCSPSSLADVLAEICREWTVVTPCDSPVTVPGAVPDDGLSYAQLDTVDAVLTGCAAACAETGTIALDAGPDQGRRALTLIPDRHVCVVRADQVVPTVPELLARLDPIRPLTFISGPSATSDIELHRVEGVHGPRTLIVVLVA